MKTIGSLIALALFIACAVYWYRKDDTPEPPPPPKLISAEAAKTLIESHLVVVGMTPAHVKAALGEPPIHQRAQAVNGGTEERWAYPGKVVFFDANGLVRKTIDGPAVPVETRALTK
jgi:hypothetical protein